MSASESDYLTLLPYEIVSNTLSTLSYRDIMAYCKTNKSANIICNDKKFWIDKLDNELQYVNSEDHIVKPSSYIILYNSETAAHMYTRWITTLNMNISYYTMVKKGYNDMIMWMLNKTYASEQQYKFVSSMSLVFGNTDLRLSFYHMGYINYNTILGYSARDGDIHTILWLKPPRFVPKPVPKGQMKHLNFVPEIQMVYDFSFENVRDMLNYAVLGSQMKILNFLLEDNLITSNMFTNSYWGFATLKDNVEVLEWLERLDVEQYIIENMKWYRAIIAAERGLFKVLEWLSIRDLIPSKTINPDYDENIKYYIDYVAKNRRLDVLQWLESKNGILPSIKGANYAAENGDMDMLLWLEERNVLPNICGNDGAAANGHLDVLKWMAGDQTGILKWFERGLIKHISYNLLKGLNYHLCSRCTIYC